MFAIATPGTQVAFDAVRRIIADAAGADAPAHAVVPAVALSATDGSSARAMALPAALAGRIVPAIVLQRLDDGSGVVDIGGQNFRVAARLPAAGETVNLHFAPAAPVLAAAAAETRISPQVTLGPLAQALSEIAGGEAKPLLLGRLPATVLDPGAFAQALAGRVDDSGLFYESHLARWSQGKYPLANLLREPQAGAAAGGSALTALPAPASDNAAAAAQSGTAGARALAPDSVMPVVREQLDILEHRQFAVIVEAWPGQSARLAIADENHDDGRAGAPPARAWVSRLALELPGLGRIEAEIALQGDQARLVVRAGSDAAARLGGASGSLADAMANAGVRMTSLRVIDDPDV